MLYSVLISCILLRFYNTNIAYKNNRGQAREIIACRSKRGGGDVDGLFLGAVLTTQVARCPARTPEMRSWGCRCFSGCPQLFIVTMSVFHACSF